MFNREFCRWVFFCIFGLNIKKENDTFGVNSYKLNTLETLENKQQRQVFWNSNKNFQLKIAKIKPTALSFN